MILQSVEVPTLPEGFLYQSVKSSKDAATLAEVHNASFGPIWTTEMYRKVMESPGYDPQRELVIRSQDGTFIAFCVIWDDRLNRMGLFEQVGTDKAYKRRGFGRTVMLYGLQQMISQGMTSASSAHFGSNRAAEGLYQSLGIKPWYLLDG
jgi:ribosomal protein S18 acetylase RimI-like enzyme